MSRLKYCFRCKRTKNEIDFRKRFEICIDCEKKELIKKTQTKLPGGQC